MSFSNEARGRLTDARNMLIDRRSQTNDPKERAAIDDAIKEINENVGILNQLALLAAATIVVDATKALEAVVRSARLAPFDLHAKDLEGTIEKIGGLLRNGEVGEHLERAPELPVVTSPPPAESTSVSAPGGSAPVPTVAVPTTPSAIGVSAPTAVSPAGGSAGGGTQPSSATVPPPSTGLTTTPGGDVTASEPPKTPASLHTAGGAVDLPPIGASSNFSALRDELDAWFKALIARDEHKDKVEWHTKQLLKNQSRYREVSLRVNRMPWAMIGVIHAMECCFNFAGHLHNGDPLTGRTKNVPSGQPEKGTPPFSWEESAVDALTQEGFNTVTDWSIAHMLYLLEKYNGFGYRKMGKPTPYLWSFSSLYEKGKYVADRRFDPQAISKQCGTAVMLKALLEKGTDLS
jgi:lysozyme family protein